ncbi:MAG: hypothetical protein JNK02_10350 [Planctomycetes bacterium]|nr:hypothetical protein [Planctomycetota bacterium]
MVHGLLCALEPELGSLCDAVRSRRRVQGVEVLELDVPGGSLLAAVSGVGKVRAAQAAAVLLGEGVSRGLLVVGTCGGLTRDLAPGTLVHARIAAQVDLAVREGRELPSDPELRAAWRRVAPGPEAWFLTADRPVLNPWRRLRLVRAFAGSCAAEMETAAVAAVAERAGVPWAALRAVTDRASFLGAAEFRARFGSLAGRAADTVRDLLAAGRSASVAPPEGSR